MKHHLLASYHAALREGHTNFAAALAALYRQEHSKPPPSPDASAVAEYLNSKPPFEVVTSHDHPTH